MVPNFLQVCLPAPLYPFRACLARVCRIESRQSFDVASEEPSGDCNTVSSQTMGNVCVAVFFGQTQQRPKVGRPEPLPVLTVTPPPRGFSKGVSPMIPDDLPEHNPEIAPVVPLAPVCCPTCGRPLLFTLRASGVLDMVVLAQAVLSDLKGAIEEECLP
jgi:hypothetical protein